MDFLSFLSDTDYCQKSLLVGVRVGPSECASSLTTIHQWRLRSYHLIQGCQTHSMEENLFLSVYSSAAVAKLVERAAN